MSGSGNPIIPPEATIPVSPPLARMNIGHTDGNGFVYPSTIFYSFLQELWAAAFGTDGIVDLESWLINAVQAPPFQYSSPQDSALPSKIASLQIPNQPQRQQYIPYIPTDPAPRNRNVALFGQTANVTVANTVTETPITSTGVGSLSLRANYLMVGRTIKIWAMGYNSAAGNPTIDVKIKLGSTVVLDTGVVTSGNSTNAMWELRAMITGITTGASGTVNAQGFYLESAGGSNIFGMVNTAAVTIDTTAVQTISVTVQWGTASAGNTLTCTNLTVDSEVPR